MPICGLAVGAESVTLGWLFPLPPITNPPPLVHGAGWQVAIMVTPFVPLFGQVTPLYVFPAIPIFTTVPPIALALMTKASPWLFSPSSRYTPVQKVVVLPLSRVIAGFPVQPYHPAPPTPTLGLRLFHPAPKST